MSPREASAAFDKYHSENFFLTQPSEGAALASHPMLGALSHWPQKGLAHPQHTLAADKCLCSNAGMRGPLLCQHASRWHAGLRKVKESFLPFWATSADVAVLLKGAQLGYDSWQSVYNPATRYRGAAAHAVLQTRPAALCGAFAKMPAPRMHAKPACTAVIAGGCALLATASEKHPRHHMSCCWTCGHGVLA